MLDLRRIGRGLYATGYAMTRPWLFRQTPEAAHHTAIRLLGALDKFPRLASLMGFVTRTPQPVSVGGVTLDSPVMVAAGLVKGMGFVDESSALESVKHGIHIIPGWRSVPLLCGAVEFGSFTRWPRMGNTSPILWRDVATQSTQNRIGLKNPGARAAAAFLKDKSLPKIFGLSLATTPGVDDPERQRDEVVKAAQFFLDAGIKPSWVTLNLSCPNTEADPHGQQSETLAQILCAAMVQTVGDIPLWVKVGPDLSATQIAALAGVFNAVGVRAVVTTNTLGEPAPEGNFNAGLAGGRLFPHALAVVKQFSAARAENTLKFDLIGCGGGLNGKAVSSYTEAGAKAVQVWSALVYRGPLAPALIAAEYQKSKS
jgi:dihydroorotate dehydrogenase